MQRCDTQGNRVELLGDPGDTIFVTVARHDDSEDDERVIELEFSFFVQLVADFVMNLQAVSR